MGTRCRVSDRRGSRRDLPRRRRPSRGGPIPRQKRMTPARGYPAGVEGKANPSRGSVPHLVRRGDLHRNRCPRIVNRATMEHDQNNDADALAWAFGQHCESATDKCMLLVLARLAPRIRQPFSAYHDELASIACCSTESVRRAVRRLAEAKLIRVASRWDATGQRLPNEYELGFVADDEDEMPAERCSVPDSLRWEVFERDDFRCRECGSRRRLQADHIQPRSKGGLTTFDNLQTLCISCNSRKRDRIPEVVA